MIHYQKTLEKNTQKSVHFFFLKENTFISRKKISTPNEGGNESIHITVSSYSKASFTRECAKALLDL